MLAANQVLTQEDLRHILFLKALQRDVILHNAEVGIVLIFKI